MEILLFLAGFVLVLLIIIMVLYYRKRWPVKNFPPGPTGVPIIGNFLCITGDKHLHRTAWKLGQQYGKVCSIMLDTPVVIVNGFEAITEALQSNKGFDFASRREPRYIIDLYNPKKLGIFSANYSLHWQHQRRFALSTLRGFGVGKSSFEEKIIQKAETLLTRLQGFDDAPLQDLATIIINTVAAVMCDTIMGCQSYDNDKELQWFITTMLSSARDLRAPEMVLLNFIPLTRLFLKEPARKIDNTWVEQRAFLMSRIKEHQTTRRANDGNPRDFVDCYLDKMAEQPDEFTMEELTYTLVDLFFASGETTANTLSYGILYMIVNPDVQAKVHKELAEVVGPSRLPCIDDRDKTPYTVATIYEILRLSCIASTFPRCATVDTTISGYSVPKGTNILVNVWGANHDPDLWPDPERLDPTRHLNNNGELLKSPDILTFGAGRRVCMGESFAKMELYLFFSILLHRCQFEVPPGTEQPSLEPLSGLNIAPPPFNVVIKSY